MQVLTKDSRIWQKICEVVEGDRRNNAGVDKATLNKWCDRLWVLLTVEHLWYVQETGQGDYDGRGQQTASPMFTAIMSGGVGISGRELYKYR